MNVDLFCVQPYMRPEDYFTREAFYHKMDRYFLAASQKRTAGRPALIVFPEDLATFLLLEGQSELLEDVKTLSDAFRAIGQRHRRSLLWTMVQYGTLRMKRAFFARGASRVWHVWHGTMARLAHDYEMTVVAGSALLPQSRWTYDTNSFMPRSANIYNMSFTLGPTGHVIQNTRKVNLVPTQEDTLELSAGPLDEASRVVPLPGANVPMGTAICYDAFSRPHTSGEPAFVNVLDALDRNGAKLVAQPSANPWWWDEPWPLDADGGLSRLRRQQWDEEGSMAALRQCTNVEVVVNPQLLLEFLDIHFDGQSRILGRIGTDVRTLVASEATRGPEADMVLHSVWDFATVNETAEPDIKTGPHKPSRLSWRGPKLGR